MDQVDNKILEKLQKLLALAASDNENEANLAMNKAEELMREHKLSVADVALNGSGAYVKSAEVVGLTKSTQKWELLLGNRIAETFNGESIHYKTGEGWKFTFVAGRTDLEIIVDLYERLRQTIKRMSKAYVRDNAKPFVSPRTLHNSYRLGVLNVIRKRLEQLQQNTAPTDESRNAYGMTGKELMVVKSRAVEQRMREIFPHTKTIKTKISRVDPSAYQQGQTDGKNVNLHRSVGGSQRPAAIGC